VLIAGGFFLLCGWAYAPTLREMALRWTEDPKYSHGFLVPVFAAIVLWVRRKDHPDVRFGVHAGGLAWLATAGILRLAASGLYLEWLDALSLLPALAGLCSLAGGREALRWAWPAIAFLAFMMPAPYTLEVALAQPLQRVATAWSTYLLQTCGLNALADGNVIWIDDIRLGVVEACSGLGMLLTFFALSTACALVLARNWTEWAVLILSAVPVAVMANVVRITLTGVFYVTLGAGAARLIYHDLAGWLMMPLALTMLWLELKLLAALFLPDEPGAPLPVNLTSGKEPAPAELLPSQTVSV
jgi:exosortase